MRKKFLTWISIAMIAISGSLLVRVDRAQAFFGAEIPFLIQLIGHAVTQIRSLGVIIGSSRETADILEEMNRGIQETIRIAETAHVPLPSQVYEDAKRIEQASRMAREIYGALPDKAPKYAHTQHRSGVEGLSISQDAFDYATFLDEQGRKIKASALTASMPAATRLTAQSMGVLIQGVDQTNRLQAKSLELSSTQRIEESAKEGARFESFINTHETIERQLDESSFSSLPSFAREVGGDR